MSEIKSAAAANNRILLALRDQDEVDGFTKVFERNGFVSSFASDGSKAMELALKELPALVVTDVGLPIISGERLFNILKNNSATSKLPFVFISDERMDIKGFRVAMDTFLVRPFNFEEVFGTVRQKVFLNAGGLGDKDIEGKLSQMSLVDILQVLHMNRKDGELKVTDGESTGVILIKEGQVYNVTLDNMEKEKALFRLFTWAEGMFSFHPTPITAPQRVETPTGNLLMEGMRQLDEMEKFKDSFPSRDTAVKAKIDTATIPKGLKPVIYELLFLIEYYQKVGDIVDHCSFTDYDAYKTLSNLISKGVIEEVGEGGGSSDDFVPAPQAIKLKEKVTSKWGDMLGVNFGKVFVLSTSPALSREFVAACKNLPGFVADKNLLASKNPKEEVMGDMGIIRLYGGFDVVLFGVPGGKGLAPFIRAMSANLIGMIILWDDGGDGFLPDMALFREDVVEKRRITTLHLYAGKTGLNKDSAAKYKRLLDMNSADPLFTMDLTNSEAPLKIFQSFFDEMAKDEYISGNMV